MVPGQPPPIGVAGYVSPSSPLGDIEMVDMSPQSRVATATGSNFEMEHLDSSPGSTLRTRSRMTNNKDDLDESIDILTESPGNKNRRRNVTKESQEVSISHLECLPELNCAYFSFSSSSPSTPTFSFSSCDPRTMARTDRPS